MMVRLSAAPTQRSDVLVSSLQVRGGEEEAREDLVLQSLLSRKASVLAPCVEAPAVSQQPLLGWKALQRQLQAGRLWSSLVLQPPFKLARSPAVVTPDQWTADLSLTTTTSTLLPRRMQSKLSSRMLRSSSNCFFKPPMRQNTRVVMSNRMISQSCWTHTNNLPSWDNFETRLRCKHLEILAYLPHLRLVGYWSTLFLFMRRNFPGFILVTECQGPADSLYTSLCSSGMCMVETWQ